MAAVDLTAFVVARHIQLGANPGSVLTHPKHNAVWALAKQQPTLFEIDPSQLQLRRKVAVAGEPVSLQASPDGAFLWLLTKNPNRLAQLSPESLQPVWSVNLPATPTSFDLSQREDLAVVYFAGQEPVLLSTVNRQPPVTLRLGQVPTWGMFQSNGKALITTSQETQQLTLTSLPDQRLITHLPLGLRPETHCMKDDGGQLYITGSGVNGVVVVYPYRGEVAETLSVGQAPRAMASVSTAEVDYLFVASPERNDVSIMDMNSHRALATVNVGKDPSFLLPTPDGKYMLVLNRASGDIAVIRVRPITTSRQKTAPLLTMIPVGSAPAAAVVRSV